MFGSILISIITLMHVYVFWRAASLPFVNSHLSPQFIACAGVAVWLIFYSGWVYGHRGSGGLARTLEMIGMDWMAALFLIFVCLFSVDIITGFGLLLSRQTPFLRGLAIAAGIVLSVIAIIQGVRAPIVENYDIHLAGLPGEVEGTVIVAMSDLHLGSLLGARWLEARVNQVNAEQPDLVVLLGDIFEGHGQADGGQAEGELIQAMNRLSAPMGVWAVYGNHSHYHRGNMKNTPNTSPTNEAMTKKAMTKKAMTKKAMTNEARFKFLCNRWTEVRPRLILAGVDDLTILRLSGNKDDFISKALSDRPPGATILLSHTPWEAEKAAKAGVGLMLCGHTHGGQIWPFGYLVKRVYPLFEGKYEVNGMTVIVCRGTGTWGPRMRLWKRGEILRVTLHVKKNCN